MFTPIAEGVAIKVVKTGRETESGIRLPDSDKELAETPVGNVIAVGPEVKQVKVGDQVIVHPSTPLYRMRFRSIECFLLTEDKIMAIVDKEHHV